MRSAKYRLGAFNKISVMTGEKLPQSFCRLLC